MGIQRLREPDDAGDGRIGDVRPLVVNVDVVDAMQDITDQLLGLADHIASQIQRPIITPAPRDAGWTPTDIARRNAVALEDATDARRWRYAIGSPDIHSRPVPERGRPIPRAAPGAASWLAHRLGARPGGPFAPLALQHLRAITDTVIPAASRIETLLRIARRSTSTGRTHDGCGGNITVSGGDGADPEARCEACGRTWRPQAVSAA
jgi:hypothetical protein